MSIYRCMWFRSGGGEIVSSGEDGDKQSGSTVFTACLLVPVQARDRENELIFISVGGRKAPHSVANLERVKSSSIE